MTANVFWDQFTGVITIHRTDPADSLYLYAQGVSNGIVVRDHIFLNGTDITPTSSSNDPNVSAINVFSDVGNLYLSLDDDVRNLSTVNVYGANANDRLVMVHTGSNYRLDFSSGIMQGWSAATGTTKVNYSNIQSVEADLTGNSDYLDATAPSPGTPLIYVGANNNNGVTIGALHSNPFLYLTASASVGSGYWSFPDGAYLAFKNVSALGDATNWLGMAGVTFTAQVYHDLLHRPVDFSGFQTVTDAINTLHWTRAQIAHFVESSAEYRTDLITQWYVTYLGRSPDSFGMQSFLNAFSAGVTEEQVQAGILGSPEFLSHTNGTNLGFLDAMYLDLLGRHAYYADLRAWGGTSGTWTDAQRTVVATGVLQSAEYRQDLVDAMYSTLLHRGPSSSELASGMNTLQTGRDEDLVAAIMDTNEYYNDAANSYGH